MPERSESPLPPCGIPWCIDARCPTATENVRGAWFDVSRHMIVSASGEPLATPYIVADAVIAGVWHPELLAAYHRRTAA